MTGTAEKRSKRRGLLQQYYGATPPPATPAADPLDIGRLQALVVCVCVRERGVECAFYADAAGFDPDAYFKKLIAERPLSELVDEDAQLVNGTERTNTCRHSC